MRDRVFTLIAVVVIGVLAGLAIVKKQVREPLLHEILQRQSALQEGQIKIVETLTSGKVAGRTNVMTDDASVAQRLNGLERRITALESQFKGVQDSFKQARDSAGAARQAPPEEDLSTVYDMPIDHSPVRGNKKAPVTIMEFVDFQCPFCARFHPPVTEVLNAYPQQVNYVLKNFPLSFHNEAKPAAKAAFAAGEQGKYWEMTDVLLENGRELNEEKYKELAKGLGLDVDKFMDDLKKKDAQWEKYIQNDMDLAQKVDVRGTPTFYINGRKTRARDFNSFKAEIDKILEEQK